MLEILVFVALFNRADCDAIRDTEYLSWEERDWYLATCLHRGQAISLDGSLSHMARIRYCESNNNYLAVNNAGYYGAWQFSPSTFDDVVVRAGHPEYVGVLPHLVPPEIQDAAAIQLYNEQGGAPWPICQYA